MMWKSEVVLFCFTAADTTSTSVLAFPTRSFAAFWIIWFTTLSAASSWAWLVARFWCSAMSAPFSRMRSWYVPRISGMCSSRASSP